MTENKPLKSVVLIGKCIYEEDVHSAVKGLKQAMEPYFYGVHEGRGERIIDEWFPVFAEKEGKQ